MSGLVFKVYSIVADGRQVSAALIEEARTFVSRDVPPIAALEGASDGVGFVILHPGETGLSVLAHWWVQGCVLCQHNYRRLWDSDQPINTQARPVVACVWELELIHAEQRIWRDTMMNAAPDPASYLKTRVTLSSV